MSSEPLSSIVSGRQHVVVQVGARTEFVLDDLLGEAEIVLEESGQRHTITGIGAAAPYGVRFYQKDPGRNGHDVRTWRISRQDHIITAVHDAAI